jgi:hypothetical protein
MSNDRRQKNRQDQAAAATSSTTGSHVFWMVAGPFLACALLGSIVLSGSGWLTGLDLGFLIVVVLMLVARWIEQRSGQATDAYGELSTWADFRRYVIVLPIVAIVVWIAANVVGNHFLSLRGG